MNLYGSIIHRISIEKGWSGDAKYCAITADGKRYLLRISPLEFIDRKRHLFEMMELVSNLGVSMCQPVEFGVCDDGVYLIQTWVDGDDAEEILLCMNDDMQYQYGEKAGQILACIHTIPAPPYVQDWETRFNAKIDRKIELYNDCALKYERGSEYFLEYIAENRHLLKNRCQTYQHGDYHIGNMMIDRDGNLVIIDFDRDDYGDPWEEFNRIVWSAQVAPAFASGMVAGYFAGQIPVEFWKLLALYISSNTLSSLPWAVPFGEKEINVMREQAEQVLSWYNDMKTVIPSWYRSRR